MSNSTNAPWQDEATLYQKYWVEGKSLTEVGDELGCSRSAVRKWLLRHELGTRSSPGNPEADYRDEQKLRELYHEKRLSTVQIADKLDCSKQTVQKWMRKYGIDTRQSYHDKNGCFFTNKDGYENFAVTQDYETTNVLIHRLVAIADGKLEPSELRNREINIHHKSGVPWDNRPGNLQTLSVAEHAKEHEPERKRNESGDFV